MAELRNINHVFSASTTRLRGMMSMPSSRSSLKRAGADDVLDQWKRKLSTFFQKAASDKSLASVLRVLCELKEFGDATCGTHKMLRRSQLAEFAVAENILNNTLLLLGEEVLQLQDGVRARSDRASQKQWCSIMHEYLEWFLRSPQQRKNLITPAHCGWYRAMLETVLETYALQSIANAAGRSMLSFLSRHILDPFNVIIGLPVAHCVQARVELLEETTESVTVEEAGISPQELLDEVLSWRNLDDAPLRAALNNVLCRIHGVHRALPGDILVVKDEVTARSGPNPSTKQQPRVVYGRCDSVDKSDGSITVFLDRSQAMSARVPLESVRRLPMAVVEEYIDLEDVQRLERCVELSEECSFQTIMEKCTVLTLSMIEEDEVSAQVLQRARDGISKLSDFAVLRRLSDSISNLAKLQERDEEDTMWAHTRDECENMLRAHVQRIECAASLEKTFLPTVQRRVRDLKDFSFEAAMNGQRQMLVGTVSAALDALEIQRKNLKNGTTKTDMVEWWLELIEAKVRTFLETYDYHTDAVAYNYTEEPPGNMEHVHANKHILSRILKSHKDGEDTFRVGALIEGLKSRIFPVLESFVADLRCIIEEEMGEGSCSDLNAAKSAAKALESEEKEWVQAGVKDLIYISEMLKMEDPTYPRDPHIIPITGLVLSVLTRFEYECNTVIDLFGWKRAEDAETVAEAQSEFHSAVLMRDIDACRHFLRTGADVSALGPSGSSALHIACMRQKIELVDVELIQEFLRNDGNPLIPNVQGLHCLFYLVRASPSAAAREEYQKLFAHTCGTASFEELMVVDDQGNSMLHVGAICNNTFAVRALLDAGLDPNIQNDYGDTPLHKAVSCAFPDIVKLLTERDADGDVRNSYGESPKSIAVVSNSPDIVHMLGGKVAKLMVHISSTRRGRSSRGRPAAPTLSLCVRPGTPPAPNSPRELWRMPESWKRSAHEEGSTVDDVQNHDVEERVTTPVAVRRRSTPRSDRGRRRTTIGKAHRLSVRLSETGSPFEVIAGADGVDFKHEAQPVAATTDDRCGARNDVGDGTPEVRGSAFTAVVNGRASDSSAATVESEAVRKPGSSPASPSWGSLAQSKQRASSFTIGRKR